MDPVDRLLAIPPLSTALLPLPGAADLYLVGGALRNALLGLPVSDFDFASPVDPTALARRFASNCGGRWFCLDVARCQSRVVWAGKGIGPLTFDFAPFRATDLEGDLRARDFTVNALALSLRTRTLHDPLGGGDDLARALLRACSPQAFTDDPLRILRAARLAVGLGFRIAAATQEQAATAAGGLGEVAAERRGDELVRIANQPLAAAGLELLLRLGPNR